MARSSRTWAALAAVRSSDGRVVLERQVPIQIGEREGHEIPVARHTLDQQRHPFQPHSVTRAQIGGECVVVVGQSLTCAELGWSASCGSFICITRTPLPSARPSVSRSMRRAGRGSWPGTRSSAVAAAREP